MTGYRRNFIAGGSFFFTVNLADRRLRLLTEHIDELRSAFRKCESGIHSQSTRWSFCTITCMPFGRCPRGCGFRQALAANQIGVFAWPSGRRTDIRKPGRQRRTWHLAAALLGAYDPRREGFLASRRLHPYQSGQTRISDAGAGLAVFVVPSHGEAWGLSGGLGRRRT